MAKITDPLEPGWLKQVARDCALETEVVDLAQNATPEQKRAALAAARKLGWNPQAARAGA